MNRHDQEKMLAEILGGDDASDFREATLAAGLKAVRQRRRNRRALYGAVPILLLALALWPHRQPAQMLALSQPALVKPASAPTPAVEEISTEQLFALFPDRPLALVGKPGNQEFVFLDQPRPAEPADAR
ncbi:MAG TPA: hypothetical protein VHH73_05125 [Verrucomicrobiae bacterium]|nr:hypothetical protein [Verrucomicrobiae bacterium]